MQVGRKGQQASERKAGGGGAPWKAQERDAQKAVESSKAEFKEWSPSRWSQVSHFAQGVTCCRKAVSHGVWKGQETVRQGSGQTAHLAVEISPSGGQETGRVRAQASGVMTWKLVRLQQRGGAGSLAC